MKSENELGVLRAQLLGTRLARMVLFSANVRGVSDGLILWKAVTRPTSKSSTRFSHGSTLPGWRVTCGTCVDLI